MNMKNKNMKKMNEIEKNLEIFDDDLTFLLLQKKKTWKFLVFEKFIAFSVLIINHSVNFFKKQNIDMRLFIWNAVQID